MSSLSIDVLKTRTHALAEEVQAAHSQLTLLYAIHHKGQLRHTLHLLEDMILEHPAGPIARRIMNRTFLAHEPSAFLGLAVHQNKSWARLYSSTAMMAVISLNVDQYNGLDDTLLDMYHQAWHALEMAEICKRPEMLERLQNRPMIPKRSAMAEAHANLRADVFAALMMATDHDKDAVYRLSRKRAFSSLQRSPVTHPSAFPFVLVTEATAFALNEVYPTLDDKRSRLSKIDDIVHEISSSTNEEQIQQWWTFCDSAQDMAWRGFSEQNILTAAIHHCEDPYIRAIAHLISKETGLAPADYQESESSGGYNPFLSLEMNAYQHHATIQETFDMVLAQGLEEDSSRPLIAAANNQNRDLLQGRILGWCAAALQAAAHAFDTAFSQGKSPEQAAKLEFEIQRSSVDLKSLKALGDGIIAHQRRGDALSLDQVATMARTYPSLESLASSVERTLADPTFNKQLAAVQELTRTIGPTGPTPSLGAHFILTQTPTTAMPKTAAPSGPMPTLDFGLGGSGGQSSRQPAAQPPHSPQIGGASRLEIAFEESDKKPSHSSRE